VKRIIPCLLLPLLALSMGCPIFITVVTPPAPAPLPALTCVDSATMSAPTAHLIIDMRIERGTVNLEPDYTEWVMGTAAGLATARILTTEAILVRLDERPVMKPVLAAWGCNLDSPQKLPPQAVIDFYAQNADLDPSPIGCAVDPLIHVGENVPTEVTSYPPDLPGTSGNHILGSAPSVAIVIHVDNRPRRTAFADPACQGAKDLFAKEGNGSLSWLKYADGINPDRVLHWFITTDELIDRDHFVAECEKLDGFPSSALDTLDPSPNALYGPLADGLSSAGAGHVSTVPMCSMLTSTGRAKFLSDRLHDVASIVGTTVNEKALKDVLDSASRNPSATQAGSATVPSG
jgi:hypothetical protein